MTADQLGENLKYITSVTITVLVHEGDIWV